MKKIQLNPKEVRAIERLVPEEHTIHQRIYKASEKQKETIRNTCYGFHQFFYDRMTIEVNFDINDAYYILNYTPYNYINATEKRLRNKFLSIVQKSIHSPYNNLTVQLRNEKWQYDAKKTSWIYKNQKKIHDDFSRYIIYIWNNSKKNIKKT